MPDGFDGAAHAALRGDTSLSIKVEYRFQPYHDPCHELTGKGIQLATSTSDTATGDAPRFDAAYPFQENILGLPVKNLDEAAGWYAKHFGMSEVERFDSPVPTVVMERDGVRIGFAVNGGDPGQDGAAIRVTGAAALMAELEHRGVDVGNWRIDEHKGQKLQVFFASAPDGLCFYFHEPVAGP
jgi:catechol 2,3-dioxygenase-like lactoylglutathione lyase family enzyme